MGIQGKRKLLVVPALAVLVFGAVASGHANAVGVPAAAVDQAVMDEPQLTKCVGRTQLGAVVLTNSASTTIGETPDWVPLIGAVVPIDGLAAAGQYQLIVTFTGEARLNGQPNVLNPVVDSLNVRILVNGVVLPPGGVVFTTDAGESNALQACTIVTGLGPHVVRVEWMLNDFMGNNALTGSLDSWELHVEQNLA